MALFEVCLAAYIVQVALYMTLQYGNSHHAGDQFCDRLCGAAYLVGY